MYGDYAEQDSGQDKEFKVTYGHSKQKRIDLKQVILSLTVNGPSNLPIWIEGLSGNKSDKASLKASVEKIELFKKQLQDTPNFIYVADSALYSKELLKCSNLRWITRIPETIQEVKKLCQSDYKDFHWEELNEKYEVVKLGSNYGGIAQRWQLIYSAAGKKRESAILETRIAKGQEKLEKDIKFRKS